MKRSLNWSFAVFVALSRSLKNSALRGQWSDFKQSLLPRVIEGLGKAWVPIADVSRVLH